MSPQRAGNRSLSARHGQYRLNWPHRAAYRPETSQRPRRPAESCGLPLPAPSLGIPYRPADSLRSDVSRAPFVGSSAGLPASLRPVPCGCPQRPVWTSGEAGRLICRSRRSPIPHAEGGRRALLLAHLQSHLSCGTCEPLPTPSDPDPSATGSCWLRASGTSKLPSSIQRYGKIILPHVR